VLYQENAADYAHSVEMAAGWLLQKLADRDADVTYAVETLESAAQEILSTSRVQQFAPAATEELPGPDELDVLDITVAQLSVAGTLLAASRATATGASPADRAALERAVAQLGSSRRDLEEDRDKPSAKAFAPLIQHSPTPAVAAGKLRGEAERTLNALGVRAAVVVRQAFSSAVGCTPGQIGDSIQDLGTLSSEIRIKERLQRLASLALRILAHAIARLSCFFPARLLDEARDRVGQLADSVRAGNRGAVTAAVLDIPAARREIAARLTGPGAAATPWNTRLLDQGTADLTALSNRFESVMAKTERVLTALVAAGRLLSLIPVVAEVRSAVLASAALAVIAAVVMIGRDYVDSGSVLGLVTGVRHVVATACREGI